MRSVTHYLDLKIGLTKQSSDFVNQLLYDCKPNWILLFVIAVVAATIMPFPLFSIGCVLRPLRARLFSAE